MQDIGEKTARVNPLSESIIQKIARSAAQSDATKVASSTSGKTRASQKNVTDSKRSMTAVH